MPRTLTIITRAERIKFNRTRQNATINESGHQVYVAQTDKHDFVCLYDQRHILPVGTLFTIRGHTYMVSLPPDRSEGGYLAHFAATDNIRQASLHRFVDPRADTTEINVNVPLAVDGRHFWCRASDDVRSGDILMLENQNKYRVTGTNPDRVHGLLKLHVEPLR